MSKNLLLIASLAFLTFGHSAKATIITASNGLSNPDAVVDFENPSPSLAQDALVTNQFAGEGLTFSTLAGGRLAYSSCGSGNLNGIPDSSGNYVSNYGPGCRTNTTDDSFSMALSTDVSALSMVGDFRWNSGITLEVLLDGLLVDSRLFTGSHSGAVIIDGNIFDEIRVIENNPASGQLVQFDNVKMVFASVPEPSVFFVMLLGLAGLVARRR